MEIKFTDFVAALLLLFFFPWLAMIIWNSQVAIPFGIPEITYWQSFLIGLMLRCWCPKPKTGYSK